MDTMNGILRVLRNLLTIPYWLIKTSISNLLHPTSQHTASIHITDQLAEDCARDCDA